MLSALLEMKASEVSSRGRLHGRIVPGTIHVGTSFMLCTQMSTSLFFCLFLRRGEGCMTGEHVVFRVTTSNNAKNTTFVTELKR